MDKTLNKSTPISTEQGYRVNIGRDTIRVISVFNGTKTASKVIYEAAVKKILFEKTAE